MLMTFAQGGVTPYMGVWIETTTSAVISRASNVTPYMGVWIETTIPVSGNKIAGHPLHGGVD